MAVFGKPFTTAEVQYFDDSKADDASAWIHEGLEVPNVLFTGS
jgi:hypothetical protein